MKKYEGLFLVNIAHASKNWDEVANHVRTILEKNGAEIVHFERWDERRLAYEIGRHRKGVYILTFFNADPQAIASIRREANLSETILRFMVLMHKSNIFERLLAERTVGASEQSEETAPKSVVQPAVSSNEDAEKNEEEDAEMGGQEEEGEKSPALDDKTDEDDAGEEDTENKDIDEDKT